MHLLCMFLRVLTRTLLRRRAGYAAFRCVIMSMPVICM